MADDLQQDQTSTAESETIAPASPSLAQKSFLRRHWGKLLISAFLLIPLVTFGLWTFTAFAFTYSSGERVGYVQKLSKKGWLCKTWEGELQMSNIPGSAPTLFGFTVRGDSLARVIQQLGGRQVALQFEQHVGVPTKCFGDTEYFITGVRELSPK